MASPPGSQLFRVFVHHLSARVATCSSPIRQGRCATFDQFFYFNKTQISTVLVIDLFTRGATCSSPIRQGRHATFDLISDRDLVMTSHLMTTTPNDHFADTLLNSYAENYVVRPN